MNQFFTFILSLLTALTLFMGNGVVWGQEAPPEEETTDYGYFSKVRPIGEANLTTQTDGSAQTGQAGFGIQLYGEHLRMNVLLVTSTNRSVESVRPQTAEDLVILDYGKSLLSPNLGGAYGLNTSGILVPILIGNEILQGPGLYWKAAFGQIDWQLKLTDPEDEESINLKSGTISAYAVDLGVGWTFNFSPRAENGDTIRFTPIGGFARRAFSFEADNKASKDLPKIVTGTSKQKADAWFLGAEIEYNGIVGGATFYRFMDRADCKGVFGCLDNSKNKTEHRGNEIPGLVGNQVLVTISVYTDTNQTDENTENPDPMPANPTQQPAVNPDQPDPDAALKNIEGQVSPEKAKKPELKEGANVPSPPPTEEQPPAEDDGPDAEDGDPGNNDADEAPEEGGGQ